MGITCSTSSCINVYQLRPWIAVVAPGIDQMSPGDRGFLQSCFYTQLSLYTLLKGQACIAFRFQEEAFVSCLSLCIVQYKMVAGCQSYLYGSLAGQPDVQFVGGCCALMRLTSNQRMIPAGGGML